MSTCAQKWPIMFGSWLMAVLLFLTDTVYGATVYWYVGILVDAVERWSSDKVKKL